MADPTNLDTILAESTQAPPDLPRLQSSLVFQKYFALLTQAERLMDGVKALAHDSSSNFDSDCLDIAKAAEAISKGVMRLREANR